MIRLLLLQIELMYFEALYERELVPITKYKYWEVTQRIKRMMEVYK